jgi:hypothetical protein
MHPTVCFQVLNEIKIRRVTMFFIKNSILIIIFLLTIAFPVLSISAEKDARKDGAVQTTVYPSLPSPGEKVAMGNDYYFIYGFDKKPKLGMIIMKVEIYSKEGKRDTSFEVLADSGMPSMRGAHETGVQLFKLSKKGDYLLPVNIVMPGSWEIRLTIKKDGKIIFRGSHQFDV